MMQIVLYGIGAGAAAALLFASVASGSAISVLLFYLAPLPILIAALGWSHWAALVAAFAGAAGLTAALGSYFFLAFLAGVGLPAWWLGYLALLAQPVPDSSDGALAWYPVGRIVLWAAILGPLVIVAAVPPSASTPTRFTKACDRASSASCVSTAKAPPPERASHKLRPSG